MTKHPYAMKSLVVRVLLVVIQLVAVSVAADQVVHSSGLRSCDTDDGAHSYQKYQTDPVACCNANIRFVEGGGDTSAEQNTWKSSEASSCDLQISHSGRTRCLISKFVGPVRWPSRRLLAGIFTQDTASTNMSLEAAHEEHKTKSLYPGIMASGFLGSFLLSCAFICPCWKPRKRSEKDLYGNDVSIEISSQSYGPSYTSSMSNSAGFSPRGAHNLVHERPGGALTFTMAELIKITGNFSPSHKIGQGGFGTVYKGTLRDGRVVAVKRAKKDTFEARLSLEFKNELDMLSQVDHLNLVRLIGYLEEEHERIIVVEFVPNGNLREHLDAMFGVVLDISTRLDIAIDVAHALTYLHMYADRPIIHRDVKATNILLTDTFRAKVADFGFSRMGPTDQGATHVSTQVKGTAGYLDPEYLTTYQLNQKSDVYSFGILLIEIFTGRRPIELKRPSDERVTIRWAFKKFVEGKVLDILDPRLEKTPPVQVALEKIADLAFACSAPTKTDRPTMKKAQEALWQIRKDYRGPTSTGSPAPSPIPSTPQVGYASPSPNLSHLSRATFPIPEADTPNPSFNARSPYRNNSSMSGSSTPLNTLRPSNLSPKPPGAPPSQNGS